MSTVWSLNLAVLVFFHFSVFTEFHEWGKNREVFTTSGTYLWSFVTQIFYNGQPSHGGDPKTTAILPEHPSSLPVFSGVRVTRSLVLYVCFVDRCLSCTFSFGHCVVCSSSIYRFWLPLWYLQTLLPTCDTHALCYSYYWIPLFKTFMVATMT
jgi:hypothetical protein